MTFKRMGQIIEYVWYESGREYVEGKYRIQGDWEKESVGGCLTKTKYI